MNVSTKSFLIACGGTGGHLFPGIAVGEKLLEQGNEVTFLISEKEIDRRATEPYQHLDFAVIPSAIMPKPWSPQMIPFLKVSRRGYAMCRALIKERQVRGVLGMGGFTSTTPLLAARSCGVPGFIHESNAIPGRANRLNARIAQQALVGWEACRAHFPASKTRVVGTPVRPELFDLMPKPEAKATLGLDPERFTVLVMGGSQGAQGINDAVRSVVSQLADTAQFIHITGMGGLEAMRNAYASAGVRSTVMEFCTEMAMVYAAADFSICRAGASSLNEMAVVGLPGLLIPYPYAADDHQSRNAEVFVKAGACLLKPQNELDPTYLAHTLVTLAGNPQGLAMMVENMKSLAPMDCAELICQLLEDA